MAFVASRLVRGWIHFAWRTSAPMLRAIVLLLMMATLPLTASSAPGPVFSNLVLTPTSGSVDAGKTMTVSFDYDVVWDHEGDCGVSIYNVELLEDAKRLTDHDYEPHHGCNSQVEWLDEKREGPLKVDLGVGSHILYLRAWGNKGPSPVSGVSETRTIVITSNDDATRVGENVPTKMVAGQQYDVSVTLKNTGTNTWAANSTYQLGAQPDDKTWGLSRVMLDAAVAPGASKEFKFKVTAPAVASSYPFQWRMLRGSAWFGERSNQITVQVVPPKPTLSVTRDPNPMLAGETFKLTWTSTNATKVDYDCKPKPLDNSGLGYTGKGTKSKVSDTETLTADPNWVDHPSDCTWTAYGPNGTDTVTETMKTIKVNYNAAFVDQNVPASVNAGHAYAASVTMKNTGTGTWAAGSGFQLGSQNPADNQTWGLSRVDVDAPVPPGETKTFTFSIKAPATLGNVNFQWMMVRAGGTWFGSKSTNKVVKVLKENAPIPVDITPPHLTNPDAGSLPGELSVNNAGAATYSIPIEVPPGTAGLKPNLSISYSSQGGNGPLGLGWSLGGMSSIHRCGKTIAQDGVNGRVRFDIGDRLCLDGQRLVLANKPLSDENYWSDKAEFRTEIDQMSRITAYGIGKTLRFKVETRDKREIWYGGNAAGANTSSNVKAIVTTINPGSKDNEQLPYDKGGALSWAVDRITDRAGNYISFTYEQDTATGEHKPVTIRYGGVGLKSHAAVQFTWEARPDAWKRYVDDARNDLRGRISHIKTYYGSNLDGDVAASGTLVRDYAFTYEKSPTSGRSMLTTAQVCALNPQTAQPDCLPATSFAWGKPDGGKQADWVYRGEWPGAPNMTTSNVINNHTYYANHPEYFAFADFENHGYTDVLEKRVSSPTPVGEPGRDWLIKDANSLGYGKYRNQYRYFHNNGSGFTEYNYKISTGQDFVVLATGDFNGDGAPDLLVHIDKGSAKICLSPMGQIGPQGAPGSMITFDCNNSLAAIGTNTDYQIPHVLDVVGDGRSALYSRFNDELGFATLCVQDSCVEDRTAPVSYLGYTYAKNGNPPSPLSSYVRFDEMVDFAGTGKQQNARWTYPHYVKKVCDADGTSCYFKNDWVNTQPIVRITGFRQPNSPDSVYNAGSAAGYTYPDYPIDCPDGGCVPPLSPYNFDATGNVTGDFNGTGYSGLVFGFIELTYPGGIYTYNKAEVTVCLSTGKRLDCGVRQKYSGSKYVAPHGVGNYVGDGQPSFRGTPTKVVNGLMEYGDPQVCRLLGDDTTGGLGSDDANIVCEPWIGLKDKGADSVDAFEMDLLGTGRTQVMVYSGGWKVYEPRDLAYYTQALDRIHQVTNGVGAISKVEYVDGVAYDGPVTRSGTSTLTYPQHSTAGVGKIVRRLTHSNGVASERSFKYSYQDAGIDVAGRGSLGFAKVTQKDEQKNITTTTTYSQQWPFVGTVLSQVVELWGNAKPLSETTNRTLQKTIVQSNKQKTYCPLSAGSKVVRYDGEHYLGTVTTSGVDTDDIVYDNRCNLLKAKTVSEGSAVDPKATFTTKTVNTYYDADVEHWLVDLVEYAKVTKEQSGDERKITRTRDVWYESNFSGRVSMEKIQNYDVDLTMTVEYNRDLNPFGLVNRKTERWYDPLSFNERVRTNDTVYDPNGRLPIMLTNAEKHAESRGYNYGSGALTSHIDANLLETRWTVDGFGRALVEQRPGGNETRSYTKQCAGDCPAGAKVAKVADHFHGSDRMAVPQVTYQDSVGHVVQSLTWGFDGKEIYVDQRYDPIGRSYETDHPRYKGADSYLASRQDYDMLDRVKTITTKDEDGVEQVLTNDYQGMVTVITNPRRQKRTEKRDVLGQVRLVIDNKNGETKFGYDAWGNLNQTIDPNGNVINVTFDDLGRKVELSDPDLGLITYTVDAAGRTRKQISPNERALNKSTTMDYDGLDRMVKRQEPDSDSHWDYDTATKGVGKLAEAYTIDGKGKKDYRRIHTYDGLGRPSTTTQVLTDGNYTSTPAYDDWGRLNRQIYQRGSDAAKEFYLRYNENGYQSSVERPGLVLSQVLTQDASNRVTLIRLGNGLTDSNTFSPHTGRMKTGMVKNAANVVRLQEGYTYDELGNVHTRDQQWDTSGFLEEFSYDELNRLWTSTVDGRPQKTFNYDAAGNIAIKSGLGNYSYPTQGVGSVRPHAVQSITGIDGTFEYDDNGNLKKGAGRDLTWTSFDMPLRITKDDKWSQFAYGPEHQRAKQTRDDGMTVYAGAQEVETKAGVTTVKTYW
ncbi:NBR1-Ig-like domain-containing protein, partial [Ideonella sp.]|uniref:NBR1-Ig-like domain-containing protein n=1 Tax=Ideonella sp. TaxID=1929293 RepID=UPI0035B3C1CE